MACNNDTLLDQLAISVDSKTFQKILNWMDMAVTPAETEGMRRIWKSNLIGEE